MSLISQRFKRSNAYDHDWILASVSGGANPLWITEWLTEKMDLQPAMRVLDLGCGRAMSSIFLAREFGVQVWATDLWYSPSENLERICAAGFAHSIFPLHADARDLPFANEFFDAIVSIDSFPYYGTDDHYLNYIARFLKPGGKIGIAGAGLLRELDTEIPSALKPWWEPGMSCLHSAPWWQRHWRKTGIVDIELTDSMEDGWQHWLEWLKAIAPDNRVEIEALESDCGNYLGYVRAIARRCPDTKLEDPITSVPTTYTPKPLLR